MSQPFILVSTKIENAKIYHLIKIFFNGAASSRTHHMSNIINFQIMYGSGKSPFGMMYIKIGIWEILANHLKISFPTPCKSFPPPEFPFLPFSVRVHRGIC
jgi:hypothetical protein